MNKILLYIICIFILSIQAIGQIDYSSFESKFSFSKLYIAEHQINKAIPLLESLYNDNTNNANINYLLGLCYAIENKKIDQSVKLLNFASQNYAMDYNPNSDKEIRAPIYVFYYLVIAYIQNNECNKAVETFYKFCSVYTLNDPYYINDALKWLNLCDTAIDTTKLPTYNNIIEKKPISNKDSSVVTTVRKDSINSTTVTIEITLDKTEKKPKEPEFESTEIVDTLSIKPKFKERLVKYTEEHEVGTKKIDYTTNSSLYGVQIGAFLQPKFVRDFKNVKNIEVYIDKNGIFRYVIGAFIFRSQAKTLLEHIKQAGYPDAFIVDVNNNMKYAKEVITINNHSIKYQIRGKVHFCVQIGAFSKIIPDRIAQMYLKVDDINTMKQNDLTILLVGKFDTYEAANLYKQQLHKNGYPDAFVVAFNYHVKIPLNDAIEYMKLKNDLIPEDKE